MTEPAILALEDGTIFSGVSIGAPGQTIGEVVFNTSMTGYQEILTDPSYCRQMVTFTYPHIGNTGTNSDDNESQQIHAAGLIIQGSAGGDEQLAFGESICRNSCSAGMSWRSPRSIRAN